MQVRKKTDEELMSNLERRKPAIVWVGILAVALLALLPALYKQSQVILELDPELYSGSPLMFALISMIQPFLLGVGAIVLGHIFAPRVGLTTLIHQWFARNKKERSLLLNGQQKVVFEAITLGLLAGALTVGFDWVFRAQLPEVLQEPASSFALSHLLSSVVYRSVTEEIMMRWGVMTAAVYVFSDKGKDRQSWTYVAGLVLSSVLFALSRYSSYASVAPMTGVVWGRLIVVGVTAAFFGFLYWKHYLEAAILAHVVCQLTISVLSVIIL